MKLKRKKRLIIILLLLVGTGTAVGLTMYALNQNINLFYSTSQIAKGEAPTDTRIRIGGMVVNGSVKRASETLLVTFNLTDFAQEVPVAFTGILPDLFKEGQGIIAQGSMDRLGVFQAVEVLAKHDENYMPPEVADSLQQAKTQGDLK